MDFSAGRRSFLRGRIQAPSLPSGQMEVVIGTACLARNNVVCRSCAEACEAAAIRFRPRLGGVAQAELNPGRCTGCGECIGVCPTQALIPVWKDPA